MTKFRSILGGKYLGDVAWGPLRRFDRQTLEAKGWRLVRDSLLEYKTRNSSEIGELDRLGPSETRQLQKDYVDVLIWENDRGRLVVQDWGRSNRQIAFSPKTKTTLVEAILKVIGP